MSSGSARSRAVSVALGGILLTCPAIAAVDLAKLQVTPQRGQSADQARRDRYECHNWAVAQTGQLPPAAPPPNQTSEPDKAKRAEMIYRIVSGAAIGASIGGIASAVQNEYGGEAVLAGAAIGGAVGAGTGAAKQRKEEKAAAAAGPDDYLRALTACLEGRGYSVAMPN